MRDYLKELRDQRGYTMQDIADKIGISKQYYSLIENGERQRKMDITLIQGLSRIFDIPLETIVCEENKFIAGTMREEIKP